MESYVSHKRRLWLYVFTALILLFLIVPTIIVIPMSFSSANSLAFPPPGWSLRWYENFFSQDKWLMSSLVSLRTAFGTMIVATTLGTMAAYGLHVGNFSLRGTIYSTLVAPLAIPSILLAIGMFFVYASAGLLNTTIGLIIAHTLVAIPFVLITVTAGFKTYDLSQEMVARSLGASRLTAFLTVTLPQLKFSVISAALLAFIVSFDEVVVSIFISAGEVSTLTKVMFSTLRDDVDPTIAAVSTLMLIIATVPPFVMQILANRKRDV
ncbi:ABC transporter permease [Rhizobium sp. TH2]|uniref:ABC transporter permease n=1 Tax=Rhizobium sp. TH2 TaxID=2775403 RepID=UPI00215708BB|nr:ABC transporter permease [Rhizobium sp. TH2]UVC10540.1 ABC transporter permease [Rhizobium sp. TH2]